MKNQRKFLCSITVVGLLLILGSLFLGMSQSDEPTETAVISDTIVEAAVTSMEVSVLSDEFLARGINTEINDIDKQQLQETFETRTAAVYSENSSFINNLSETRERCLDTTTKQEDITIAAGVSNCEIVSIHYDDEDHATVKAVMDTWTKRIAQNETGEFVITVPMNRDSKTIAMVKEDGQWKVLKYIEYQKEFIDDSSPVSRSSNEAITTAYDAYDEAFAAAKAYDMPSYETLDLE